MRCTLQIAHDLLQTVLAKIAVAAVQLQRLVGDVETRVGDIPFGHRAQFDFVVVVAVQCRGRPPQHQSRRFQRGGHVGQGEPDGGLVEQGSPERLAMRDIGRGLVVGGLRAAQRAGRDVDPAAVEAVHRDAEAAALAVDAAEHRVGRHPHPVEHHLRGRLRVPAHLLFVCTETQPWRSLFDDERRYAAGAGLSVPPVLAITTYTSEVPAPEMNCLTPSST